ncbi:MAG: VanZ family protein [Microbacterium arborescens]
MIAIAIGALVGIVLFVPFVAVQYRRAGSLTAGRFALFAAALVYFFAIWTYTLLPLPDPAGIRCAGVNVDPLQLVDDLRGAASRADGSARAFVVDTAVLQLALNVLLFLPLGFFVRVLGRRGVFTAIIAGFGVSLVVELTQLTGVWGLYPCAYRVFDVDDLLTNTTGALLGSVIAMVVPRHAAPDEPDAPRPVTRRRRLLAMVCDLLSYALVGILVSVGIQAVFVFTGNETLATGTDIAGDAGAIAALVVVSACVLVSGRTIGDLAVRLRYEGGPLPALPARLTRLLGGIGGYALLDQLPTGWSLLTAAFFVVAAVLALATSDGRGLPGILGRTALRDSREDPPTGPPDITRSGDASRR